MTTKPKRSRRNIPGPVPVPSRWGVPERCRCAVGASSRAVAERILEAIEADLDTALTTKGRRIALAAIERAMGEGE